MVPSLDLSLAKHRVEEKICQSARQARGDIAHGGAPQSGQSSSESYAVHALGSQTERVARGKLSLQDTGGTEARLAVKQPSKTAAWQQDRQGPRQIEVQTNSTDSSVRWWQERELQRRTEAPELFSCAYAEAEAQAFKHSSRHTPSNEAASRASGHFSSEASRQQLSQTSTSTPRQVGSIENTGMSNQGAAYGFNAAPSTRQQDSQRTSVSADEPSRLNVLEHDVLRGGTDGRTLSATPPSSRRRARAKGSDMSPRLRTRAYPRSSSAKGKTTGQTSAHAHGNKDVGRPQPEAAMSAEPNSAVLIQLAEPMPKVTSIVHEKNGLGHPEYGLIRWTDDVFRYKSENSSLMVAERRAMETHNAAAASHAFVQRTAGGASGGTASHWIALRHSSQGGDSRVHMLAGGDLESSLTPSLQRRVAYSPAGRLDIAATQADTHAGRRIEARAGPVLMTSPIQRNIAAGHTWRQEHARRLRYKQGIHHATKLASNHIPGAWPDPQPSPRKQRTRPRNHRHNSTRASSDWTGQSDPQANRSPAHVVALVASQRRARPKTAGCSRGTGAWKLESNEGGSSPRSPAGGSAGASWRSLASVGSRPRRPSESLVSYSAH